MRTRLSLSSATSAFALGVTESVVATNKMLKAKGGYEGMPRDVAVQVIAWTMMLALMSNDEDDPWITGAAVAV